MEKRLAVTEFFYSRGGRRGSGILSILSKMEYGHRVSREGQKRKRKHSAEQDLHQQQWTTVRTEITHSLQRKYTALSSARDDDEGGALTHCVTERECHC